jgi:hypothetical protein
MSSQFRGNPLKKFPTAADLRKRLGEVQEYTRKIELLLELAEKFEHESSASAEANQCDKAGGRTHAGAH